VLGGIVSVALSLGSLLVAVNNYRYSMLFGLSSQHLCKYQFEALSTELRLISKIIASIMIYTKVLGGHPLTNSCHIIIYLCLVVYF